MRFPALLMLLCISSALAEQTCVVRKIEFRGLKATRPWVVERELYFHVGDTISTRDLDDAHKRLHNLTVFNDAELAVESAGTVLVDVTEAWPILPQVSVSLDNGNLNSAGKDFQTFWDNLNLLLGVRHLNFRGNAEQLYSFAQLGQSNGFFVGFSTRWLSPRQPLSVKTQIQFLTKTDRHASVLDSSRHMRDDGASLEIGTRVGARRRVALGAGYQHVERENTWPAQGGTFDLFRLSPYVELDYRDLEWWPSRGGLTGARCNFHFGTTDFITSQYAVRGYFPLKSYFSAQFPHRPPVVALQLSAATSTTNTPSFAHYYHGFEQGFRGYRSVQSESSGFIVGDVELRFPITVEATYSVPFIGRWGRRWPIGMAGVLFAERGELQLNNTRTQLFAFGGGIYVRVPYAQLIELAFAQNRDGEHEYTIKLGVSF